ncbi:uncharacterized protein HD556DRAFT_1451750 [Suillus plorans]|uniref:Myb/SANT-like domain-containing protein n=1 Tax=Suillus plorans TaxID=116603 RepID=A0A9P7A8P5_9AGAM|nr:uncharacterized protein HD556DRAFT_1451750 [Suillus plorans]KAG1784463.1 hypothetical protein HD556DRAFT_1451750 [Suillus plorans]
MSDKSSISSSHSLRSRGAIDVASAAGSGTTRKAPAVWSKAEESTFLDFLLLALSSSGDGGFKMATFNQASVDLKLKYPHQRGAEKTGVVCKNKFMALKKVYHTVVEIKCTSGFTWSNEHGAGIMDRKDDVWARFTKTHPHAKPFMMKGFDHFETMEQLVPSKAKGSHVFRPTATSNTTPQDSTTSMSPLIPTAIDDALQGPPSLVDPDSLEVPAPSTFLSPSTEGSTDSVWTSISRGKRKFSAVSPSSIVSFQKRSRPPSATLLVQQEEYQKFIAPSDLLVSTSPPFFECEFPDLGRAIAQHHAALTSANHEDSKFSPSSPTANIGLPTPLPSPPHIGRRPISPLSLGEGTLINIKTELVGSESLLLQAPAAPSLQQPQPSTPGPFQVLQVPSQSLMITSPAQVTLIPATGHMQAGDPVNRLVFSTLFRLYSLPTSDQPQAFSDTRPSIPMDSGHIPFAPVPPTRAPTPFSEQQQPTNLRVPGTSQLFMHIEAYECYPPSSPTMSDDLSSDLSSQFVMLPAPTLPMSIANHFINSSDDDFDSSDDSSSTSLSDYLTPEDKIMEDMSFNYHLPTCDPHLPLGDVLIAADHLMVGYTTMPDIIAYLSFEPLSNTMVADPPTYTSKDCNETDMCLILIEDDKVLPAWVNCAAFLLQTSPFCNPFVTRQESAYLRSAAGYFRFYGYEHTSNIIDHILQLTVPDEDVVHILLQELLLDNLFCTNIKPHSSLGSILALHERKHHQDFVMFQPGPARTYKDPVISRIPDLHLTMFPCLIHTSGSPIHVSRPSASLFAQFLDPMSRHLI